MNVLIGCEYTNTGGQAFRGLGHAAISCDLDPSEGPEELHIQDDIMRVLQRSKNDYWDLIILHPDCTAMALCGNGTYAPKGVMSQARFNAISWTLSLWDLAKTKGKRVCLENPGSVIFPRLRLRGALVQYIQPWQFGHPETKNTGLALHNLPKLKGTNNVYEYMMTLPKKERHKVWYASPSRRRGKDRSRSYPGILGAMAGQWGLVQTGQT